ncbi:MAG: aspartate aminotransferase family protein [Thermaerobacter sp.]|nr:aspartate aminotransferase family protein [Thermaerobacter sp.]
MTDVFYRSPASEYPQISHGEGIYLWDTTGKRYLDGASGALVANLGHGRQEIAQAMAAQAGRVAFAHTMRFTSAAQEELAARIARLLPYGLRHTYPVSGGSEATETAIKLARQYFLEIGQPQRFRVLARWASYHGNSLGALSASGHLARRRPYAPLLSDAFAHFPPPDSACPGPGADGECDCTRALRAALEQSDPATVAAILLEPVGGSALSGLVPHDGYFEAVRRIADEYGILLIADEVMTGFGRTGEILGMCHFETAPDLITAAKGLSGGYAPLGAVIAGDRVYGAIRGGSGRFAHGFTYGGHPVACAAGAKALEILEREQLVDNARRMGALLRAGLEDLAQRFPAVQEVRGLGLMQGLVLQTAPNPGAYATRLSDIAFADGLIVYAGSGGPEGVLGDHVLIAPPLVVDAAGVQELLDLLAAAFATLASLVRSDA